MISDEEFASEVCVVICSPSRTVSESSDTTSEAESSTIQATALLRAVSDSVLIPVDQWLILISDWVASPGQGMAYRNCVDQILA